MHRPHRGSFLITWLWWSEVGGGACVPASLETITIGETVLSRLSPPGHQTDSSLKHTSSLSVRKAYLYVLKLQPEGETSGLHRPTGYTGALRKHRPGNAILMLSPHLAIVCWYLLEKTLYTYLEPWFQGEIGVAPHT